MHSKTAMLRTTARHAAVFAAAMAAGLLAAAGLAQAQDVSPLNVDGSRPTSMTVRIAGLNAAEVHREVRKTAFTVCRNAVRNGDLEVLDIAWCANGAKGRALSLYRSALRSADGAGRVQAASLTLRVASSD